MSKVEELIKSFKMFYTETSLSNVAEVYTGKQLNKSEMNNDGLYAVINGGIEASGYTNCYNEEENTITISQGGASAGYVNWNSNKIWIGAHCYAVHPKDRKIGNRYLYFILKERQEELMQSKQGAGIPGLNRSNINRLLIPLPHIKVQEEIVKILDSFTNLIDALNEELSLRQKQFEYYREKLLTFDDNIQLKEIGELCSKVDNIKWNNNIELNYIDLSSVPCKDNRIIDCQLVNRDNAPSRARQIIKTNDILFGTTRPTQMRLCVVPKEYNNQICSTGYCVLRINNMNQKYIYYCLSSLSFMDYCDLYQDGGSYPSISDGKVKAYEIPIPSHAIQQSIVEKLDAFESLISSLKEEIALRQKQYEYYREKLLTFD